MYKKYKYIVKATKEEIIDQCIAKLLDLEDLGYDSPDEINGVRITHKTEKNVFSAEIEYDLNVWSLMDLPNLWESREYMLENCQDVAEQLPDYSFKIVFDVHLEGIGYLQSGECMFTGKWIKYSDFAYADSPPTYLDYFAAFVNGQFCDEEKELSDEDRIPIRE